MEESIRTYFMVGHFDDEEEEEEERGRGRRRRWKKVVFANL